MWGNMAKKAPLPYENASSGSAAIAEAERILRRFGCDNFGVMNDWASGVTIIQFQWKDRRIHLEASWAGYSAAWLKDNPYSDRMRRTKAEHMTLAQQKGQLAVPSILRDWVKAQVTAIEVGIMPFDHAFMPHMLANDGRRVIEHMKGVLQICHVPGGEDDQA